ncbi:MAG: POTRA domain-containing protein, partial [Candidatus Auribacterota bacterium]|nr:POTRA domain-containing protein [Candidatus Auribacterota bacterium]
MNFKIAGWLMLLSLFFLLIPSSVFAQETSDENIPLVKKVSILGNKAISENVISNKIKTRSGSEFEQKTINEDI